MGKRLIVYIPLLSIFSTVLLSFDCNAFDIIESYLDDSKETLIKSSHYAANMV